MNSKQFLIVRITAIVALGGFLMGFDASVISGVVRFIEPEFGLSKLQLGWAVGSLTLTSTLAMLLAGPLSDRFGRLAILKAAAVLFGVSAIASALAPTFTILVIARMIGGLGVGASLIVAPMFIAEISPPKMRGKMVSVNQLNIVIGISAAFFTNYLILRWGQSEAFLAQTLMFAEYNWRWMLGLETLPAIIYFIGLFFVPQSPRWQIRAGKIDEARQTMNRLYGEEDADKQITDVINSLEADKHKENVSVTELLQPALRFVLIIGISLAILQQITGINAVFFYAPMIFEQSGIGTDASFMQAVLVGLTNLVFTILAIMFIDRFGRKPLLLFGMTGIALMMILLSYGFHSASYELTPESIETLDETIDRTALVQNMSGTTFPNDVVFKQALAETIGQEAAIEHESAIITAAIDINPTLILLGILGFVASFAISIGPVMWVMFSELFPLRVRGLAISLAGFINSGVSFLVQLVFPWELATLGNSMTFLIYGLFAIVGLLLVWKVVPETKNKSLEELEEQLVRVRE
ncbi:sugar porter family MFS transporter [Balneolales bacterium ANBcel1]|nr:sugar porter family MFS transporter [Balneolales bacterium ANBcel1]